MRIGALSIATAEENSSIQKEFSNVIDKVEGEEKKRNLFYLILFLCTNNSMFKIAVAKGNLLSQKLFSLVKRIKTLPTKYTFTIYIILVSGTCMILQGTNSLSWVNIAKTSSSNCLLRCQVPINLNATERIVGLDKQIKSQSSLNTLFLEPMDQFIEVHNLRFNKTSNMSMIQSGSCLWLLPLCIADASLKQLHCTCTKY